MTVIKLTFPVLKEPQIIIIVNDKFILLFIIMSGFYAERNTEKIHIFILNNLLNN